MYFYINIIFGLRGKNSQQNNLFKNYIKKTKQNENEKETICTQKFDDICSLLKCLT